MPPRRYHEKEVLLAILKPDEIEMLKKDYPFMHQRNAKIYELRQKGVGRAVLMELSGLGKSTISLICQLGGDIRPSNRADDLIKIKKRFNEFYRELKTIFKRRNYLK